MRLDRYISHATGRTRSRARSLVRAGRVAVGGATVRDVGFDIGDGASVTCDGVILALPGPLYLMLHKPCGVVSATRDGRHATVSSLLPAALAARVHLVGRLD
ncbi:MAG: S4 domain-containing protein, partial [Gammaproteobacteria bacterium]|nr:S4 domain-containing protein [Gammaproteobacteria bacterium]